MLAFICTFAVTFDCSEPVICYFLFKNRLTSFNLSLFNLSCCSTFFRSTLIDFYLNSASVICYSSSFYSFLWCSFCFFNFLANTIFSSLSLDNSSSFFFLNSSALRESYFKSLVMPCFSLISEIICLYRSFYLRTLSSFTFWLFYLTFSASFSYSSVLNFSYQLLNSVTKTAVFAAWSSWF